MTPPFFGASTRTRQSPFYKATVADGVQAFTVYNHMLMPTAYESPEADYWHLVRNVTMWDVACERQVEMTGPDAFKLVQRLTPRDISGCRIGQGKYAPLVAEDGGLINDPILLRLGANHFWLSLADSDVLLWVRGLAHAWGLDVKIVEPDVSPLAVQGPNWAAPMVDLLGDWVMKLRFFDFREYDLDGIPLVVARSGWSTKGGLELYLRDGSQGMALWERVKAAGAPYDIRPATPSTIERIESGLLSYGNDMTLNHNPFEVRLDKYCDLNQPAEFIGKAALQRIQAEGVKRRQVGVTLDGPAGPPTEYWWPIRHNGVRVGEITSGIYSPRVGKNIGLAMVPVALGEPGTAVVVEAPWGDVAATITTIPFI